MGKKWSVYLMIGLLLTLVMGCGTIGGWPSNLTEAMGDKPNAEEYDLIVVGGEPEGVVAAVAAARSGLKTLLIEKRDGLGGVLTYAQLNFLDLAYYQDQNINRGLFAEWHGMVGGGYVFDPEEAKIAFLKMVRQEPKITLLLQTNAMPLMSEDGTHILGVQTTSAFGVRAYTAKRVIDATEDADLAALAGVPYFTGQEDIGIQSEMAVTLMIHLKNVDWEGLQRAVTLKKFGGGRISDEYAWGFPELKDAYRPHEEQTRLRGLNIARTKDGTVWLNALQILDVDGTNPEEKRKAYEKGKRETNHVVAYLRQELPGFEKAEIASIPPDLYVRETRHIVAEYQLPITDLWENKDQWDRIGFGGYPVDMQATSAMRGDVIVADPELYALPFRSLVPLKVEGLLVASRSAGYSSLAAGSARTVPTGMTAGEAAGIATDISIQHGVTFREMSRDHKLISELQTTIAKRGGFVQPVQIKHPYQGETYYSTIRKLLQYGLIAGGYGNDLNAEQPMTEQDFVEMVMHSLRFSSVEQMQAAKQELNRIGASTKPLTRDKMIQYYLAALNQPTGVDPWHQAKNQRLLDPDSENTLTKNRVVLRHEGFRLITNMIRE